MKRFFFFALVSLMLIGVPAAAVDGGAPASEPAVTAGAPVVTDAKPVDAGVVVEPAKSDDPVADADADVNAAIKPVDENPVEQVNLIIQAFKDGRWAAAIGLLVMFLVWVLRRFIWKLIPKNVLPWLTLGLGCTVTVTTGLIAGVVWWQALIDGFIASASAMALWSMLFKHFMAPKTDDA